MAAKTGTYTLIGTVTVANTTTITATFSSIPNTYTDLVLVYSMPSKSATNETMLVRVNSDSGANYSTTRLLGNGSTAASSRVTGSTYASVSGTATDASAMMGIIHFNDYANTTTFKTFLARFGQAAVETDTTVNLWRSTAAINTILFQGTLGYLGNGSTFKLYGIEAGNL